MTTLREANANHLFPTWERRTLCLHLLLTPPAHTQVASSAHYRQHQETLSLLGRSQVAPYRLCVLGQVNHP